jgi:Fe-S-cluster containining protein
MGKLSKVEYIAREIEVDKHPPLVCGECSACCKTFPAIALTAEESPHYLSSADGTSLLIDSDGVCAYLINDGCSIYDTRPQACRSYDCRKGLAWGVDDNELADNGRPTAEHFFATLSYADTFHEAVLNCIKPGEDATETYKLTLESYYRIANDLQDLMEKPSGQDYRVILGFTKWLHRFINETHEE